MRLQITKSTNAECFYVVKSVYENKKRTNVVVEKLGNLNDVKLRAGDQDPYEWAKVYVEELNRIEKEGLEQTVTAEYNPNKTLESDKRTLWCCIIKLDTSPSRIYKKSSEVGGQNGTEKNLRQRIQNSGCKARPRDRLQ